MPAAKQPDQPSFEDALTRLESLVDSMEQGQVPLAELIARYEEGTKLLKVCEARLKDAELKIDQLTHEMAILKRWKFAARSEQLHGEQRHLFDETLEADLEAIGLELAALKRAEDKTQPKDQPKRAALPPNLPRTEVRHEPESTVCACGCALKRIGEDVSEKLDYAPGQFTVERHIRSKWACKDCETIIQAYAGGKAARSSIPPRRTIGQAWLIIRRLRAISPSIEGTIFSLARASAA